MEGSHPVPIGCPPAGARPEGEADPVSEGEAEPVGEGSDEDQGEAEDADSESVLVPPVTAQSQPILLNASTMLMAPGPMMTMKSAGKMHSSIGKRILTGTFCAFSSAS